LPVKSDDEARTATLKASFDAMALARSSKRKARALAADKTLQLLVATMVAARVNAGLTQTQVAELMWTTKSVVSRLESGRCTRPSLSTIEKYAHAVGCEVEIRLSASRRGRT
jgi:predicted transcriptional regulator